MSEYADVFRKARRHLARRDPVLKRLIGLVGPCTLQPEPDGFAVLVRSVIAQLISTKAAAAIHARLLATLGKAGLTPAAVLKAGEAKLRAVGLSRTKALALRDLAGRARSGALPLADFPTLSDEEVIGHLVPVRGIGRWTAEMFLIFALGRLDVLPLADFGLRAGVKRHYGLEELPAKDQLVDLAEPWRPYRSVGTWFIWRTFGAVPQSEGDGAA